MGCSLMGYCWNIGNGSRVRFWEDNWLGSTSLAIQFWKLYRIVNEKNMSVADIGMGRISNALLGEL